MNKKFVIAVLGLALINCSKTPTQYHVMQISSSDFITKIIDYNQAEYQYLGTKPAIVDFYADWCQPCKISSPFIEHLANEYGDKIDFYKMDTEQDIEPFIVFSQITQNSGIPFFLFFLPDGSFRYVVGWGDESPHLLKEFITQQML